VAFGWQTRLFLRPHSGRRTFPRISTLEAVREFVPLAHTDAIRSEEDRRLIIGIESETDHLPVGDVRQLWAAEALREKNVEIARAEALWKAKLVQACKRIVDLLPKNLSKTREVSAWIFVC
jgi:hypothetical protein